MTAILAYSDFYNALAVAGAMAVAGAVLSVFVVLRRWAFVGEGIGHSGVGGAGTAWLLSIWLPWFEQAWVPYASIVLFCLLTAFGIGYLIRGGRVDADTAIGIFLVASLAWGFLGQQVYLQARRTMPAGWETLIFGQMRELSRNYALAAVVTCSAVLLIVGMLKKEILSYCLDPLTAEVSGVPTRFVHYLLMLLLAVTIIVGTKIAGGVLVTALLVLPGATALHISQKLRTVMILSISAGLAGAIGGIVINSIWRFIPTGPIIVLVLVVEFVFAYVGMKIRRPAG